MELRSGINDKRVFAHNGYKYQKGNVIYWMSRDQRVEDNWAFIYSMENALHHNAGFAVIFCLVDDFLNASGEQFSFMINSFPDLEKKLAAKNIPFIILKGKPEKAIPPFIKRNNAGMLITDFDPLRIKNSWKNSINELIDIPFLEVDAHNIVPCRYVSGKKDFAARTFRPKISSKLPEFLIEYPDISNIIFDKDNMTIFSSNRSRNNQEIYSSYDQKYKLFDPGENASYKILNDFIDNKLNDYATKRNKPSEDVLSNLSPYLHFGHISAQRIALEIKKAHASKNSKDAFLEELIVRKELSDNFCFYEKNYDNFDGFHDWAKKTLNDHRSDHREYLYSEDVLENAETHDDLWNTAQKEMLITGKMHGYMRMYWAKKILEWSKSPEKAMETAIYLNDKYQLDGRDPNGYTGIAWSIGGIHDRPWQERQIFGKVRYMSYNSQIKKIDLDKYNEKIKSLTL